MIECRLVEINEVLDRQRVGTKHGDATLFVDPGMMWFLPSIYDHQDPDLEQYLPELIKDARVRRGKHSLSLYYLEDWALKRDPLCMMLPMVGLWYPDSCPGSIKGWRVKGGVPVISITVPITLQNVRFDITDGLIHATGYSQS